MVSFVEVQRDTEGFRRKKTGAEKVSFALFGLLGKMMRAEPPVARVCVLCLVCEGCISPKLFSLQTDLAR